MMWVEITLSFTATQVVETHAKLEEEIREVLTVDKMPGGGKIWVNLSQALSILFLEDCAVIMLGANNNLEVHDPEEIAYLKALLSGDDENDDWEEMIH